MPAATFILSSLLDDAHSVDPDGTVPLPFPTTVWHLWCKGTTASELDAETALFVAKVCCWQLHGCLLVRACGLHGDVRCTACSLTPDPDLCVSPLHHP